MRNLLRRAIALLGLVALAGSAGAQDYPYRNVPKLLYYVGQPDWDKLPPGENGARRLELFDDIRDAQARGGTVYRLQRHLLADTPDGKAFLEQAQQARLRSDAARLSISLRDPASLSQTVLKIAKTGTDLGPPNPNWHTTGPYATKNMEGDYLPGGPKEDYAQGTFYFWNEGSPGQVNFIDNFKVHFERQPDGSVLLMQVDPNNPSQLRPIDTRGLNPGGPGDVNTCLFVMDAAGNFYVLAPEWIAGLPEAFGLSRTVNHSAIPAGHPVAAAGHMTIEAGRLKLIDNRSGHYHPSNAMTVQAINALERQNVAKGSYKVGFGNGANDHPGASYIALDPEGEAKVKKGEIQPPKEPTDPAKKPIVDDAKATINDAELLQPQEQVQRPQLDAERLAQLQKKYEGRRAAIQPVEPPSKEVQQKVHDAIANTAIKDMTVEWMRSIYKMDPAAAKLVGQIMADNPAFADKNVKMGMVRKEMDLMVWKELLKEHNIRVEITNQGKSNGIKSDLDYTLYYLAEEAGISIADLITEHGEKWQQLHQISPEQVEIKVMNGDEFYPDWRNEALSEWDHQAEIKRLLGTLRMDKEKYSVPGANKQQVHNRALRDGWTERLGYNPELDKPDIPMEQQVVIEAGETRVLAERYQGVHPQYNHMNALGNVVQNMGEYLHHSGDGAQDMIRRAKYGNRIINEGLGNLRFFANSYQQIYESKLPQDQKDRMLKDYLKKTFGLLVDENSRPLLDDAKLEQFKKVIDISMQIEMDKTKPSGDKGFEQKQLDYFKDYRQEAVATVTRELENQDVKPEVREKLILAEQQHLFETAHKQVLAEATLSGLRQSVFRDLTAEGVLRNRVRFDPATNKFVMNDPEGARKVAFERAVEVALFYELVNSLPDRDMRIDLKKRALASAPDIETAEFYGALDQVTHAEIDRFIKGEAGDKIQRKIEDLIKKQQDRALELAIEQKEKAIEYAKSKGVPVEPTTITPEQVRDHIVETRMWGLSPERRAQFRAAYQELGGQLKGDFKEAFYNNASALMMGSSAVNLIRAYQAGGAAALPRAVFSEAIWYMPDYIQTPFLVVDLLAKVREGRYVEAAWSASLFAAMAKFPALGHAMLAYNIVSGTVDIVHTHFVTRIDKDLTEQALKARPRDDNGGPLRDGVRARPSRWPDAKESVYHGSPPWFPLYYGRYKNENAISPAAVVDGVKYSDGTVPHDNLSDAQLADSAAVEFAPAIDSLLTASGLQPGSPEWASRAWELKLKFGFDIPFYRRIAKVYDAKFKYVTYFDNYPSPYNPEYLTACRLDVYDWFVRQIGPSGQTGYQDELRGDATFFFGDQSDKMQELIARECAVVMGNYHEAVSKAEELDQKNMGAFKGRMAAAFDAERGLLAAKQALNQRIQGEEEKAAQRVEQKALDLAQNHKTAFELRYPFTWASEELPPNLEFVTRTLPAKVKQPVRITLDEEITGLTEGAPGGWQPGKDYEDRFKPDSSGWAELRPITADVKFTGHLLDADSAEVSLATLTLPVVLYEPSVSGSISITVYGLNEKGDSSLYNGALVTLGNKTQETGPIYGSTSFGRLKPGSYSVKVTAAKGDQRHGPGSGSAAIVDVLLSKDPNAKDVASIVVKLPYIPEKKDIANKPDSSKTGGNTGGAGGGNKPGDKTGGGTGGTDSTGTKWGKGVNDSTTAGPTIDDIIKGLGPVTSKSEKARDDAKKSCYYIQAAAAQEEPVTAARDFVAKSFPKGAPANIQQMVQEFEAELATLKKTAKAQDEANVFLREGLAAIRSKHAEPALDALEKASKVDGIPQCLYDQVMKTYNDLKRDVEGRMKLIDRAVEAANDKCDYAAAQSYGEQVEAEDKTLSWVVNELPKIKDLNRRQKQARTLAEQAEAKAAEADAAAAAGDKAQATLLYDQALQLAQQALAAAPACEKENLKSLLDLPARKANMSNPKVDQSLILLLDTSGSMGDNNKMENAKQAATDAVKSLGATTEVALISYDGGCAGGWRVVQDFTTNHQSLINAITALRPGGGTPTAPAVGFANDYLQKNGHGKAGQIMLMTDGQNDCGSMVDAGAGLRRSSIPVRIDAVGFGVGTDSGAQKDLGDLINASGGGGSAYNANNAKELISAFRRAFITTQVKARDPIVTGEAGTRLAALFAAAVEALKANNLRGAIDQFRSAADQFPASPAAAFNASLAYEAGGQPLQAMNYAKKYLSLAPNAFDAGQVQARIDVLEKEQAANPRAIYAPTDCGELYRWAQRESRTPGMDAVRKAKVFDILTTAQRGDCPAAQAAYDKYVAQYGKKP